jgi:hypothetical protein
MELLLAVFIQSRIAPADAVERGSAGTSAGPSARTSAGPSHSNRPRSPRSQRQRHLRASRLADISGRHRCRYTNSNLATPVSPMIAPLTLGALAIASTLATQRHHPAPSRSRSLAAAWRGANREPEGAGSVSRGGRPSGHPCGHPSGHPSGRFALQPKGGFLAALGRLRALSRPGNGPESRRPRGRARSARVMAVHRQEVDLDRFVAALLALACEPGGRGERRPGQPRARTGESRPTEQSCRRR